MIRYEVLKNKPKQLLSPTGFTPEELSALLPAFSKRFSVFVETKTLAGKDRRNDGIRCIKIVAFRVLKTCCFLFSSTCEKR